MKKFVLSISICLSLLAFSYLFVDPNLPYLHQLYTGMYLKNRVLVTVVYFIIIILFTCFYLLVIRDKKLNIQEVKKYLLAISVLLFSYPAMLSYDIFNYILTAKVLYFYRENPYIVMPNEFVSDPFLVFSRATNKIALYGPSWLLFSAIPHFLGFGNFLITLFAFKIFITLFYFLAVYFIWKISNNLFSVVLFACNPLILIETFVSGHNDVVMVSLVLGSFYFLQKKNNIISIFLFLLSLFIKYATVFLLPILFYCLYKNYKKESISWEKIYVFSGVIMLLVFFLSQIREEIYPWYAIWFLPFFFLTPQKKLVLFLSIGVSIGMLLTDIPYMFLGTYAYPTPLLKICFAVLPVIVAVALCFYKNNLWVKKFVRLF